MGDDELGDLISVADRLKSDLRLIQADPGARSHLADRTERAALDAARLAAALRSIRIGRRESP